MEGPEMQHMIRPPRGAGHPSRRVHGSAHRHVLSARPADHQLEEDLSGSCGEWERPVSPPVAAPARYLAQVATATALVALCPILIVWWLRVSGIVSSYLPGMVLGIGLSLGAAHVGRALWQRRPGSQHLLFSELMVWGFARRWLSERRLASARAVLGSMSHAQDRMADGLSAEQQVKLLEQLARGLDARDPSTHGHSRRVACYSWMIARRMGLPREEVARVRTAAAIHDVGKIKTPTSVLRKAGPLSDAEYEVMKRHAIDGALMAAALNDEGLTMMVRHHHERLTGTGYPSRLSGEEIPLGARIIAVADTFDSITANRHYRAARSHKEALDILHSEAGKQLDPVAVRAFCGHYAGRRPLAFWASLTSLPERLIAQLARTAGGVAAAGKAVAVAALVGNLAAGSATLARPLTKPPQQQLHSANARAMSPGGQRVASHSAARPFHPARRTTRVQAHAHNGPVLISRSASGQQSSTARTPGSSSGTGTGSQPTEARGPSQGNEKQPGPEATGGKAKEATPQAPKSGSEGPLREAEAPKGAEPQPKAEAPKGAEPQPKAEAPKATPAEPKGILGEVTGKVKEVLGKL
jgi:hypothetical protein